MIILLYIILVLLVALLIGLVETVALTWTKWSGFAQCLIAAMIANLVSTALTVSLLILTTSVTSWNHLLIGWGISFLVDSAVLMALKRQPIWQTLRSAAFANLMSYMIIIAPTFYYAQNSPF